MDREHISAKYRGHNPILDGKTALVIVDGQDPTKCKAQFDDLRLPHEYTHGWQVYPTAHFNIRPSQLVEHWEVQGRN